jgi:hypothetical protein
VERQKRKPRNEICRTAVTKVETSQTRITGVSVKFLFSVMYDKQEAPLNFASDKVEHSDY